jgi:hypothetical protein
VNDPQHRREQLRMASEEDAQRDRKRKPPLPDRHARDDLIDKVHGALSHAPGAA